jgi:hypothetical protein
LLDLLGPLGDLGLERLGLLLEFSAVPLPLLQDVLVLLELSLALGEPLRRLREPFLVGLEALANLGDGQIQPSLQVVVVSP